MKKQNRATLRQLFRDGALPKGEDYALLIESMVNRADDGFDKPDEDGLRLTSAASHDALISFYHGAGSQQATWTIRHGSMDGALAFQRGADPDAEGAIDDDRAPLSPPSTGPALTLSPRNDVGIGTEAPEFPLDVGGTVRMRGRIGHPTPTREEIPADGEWHDIATGLSGCHALEVMAGVGGVKRRGRYALLHAVAMNAYNPGNWFLNTLFGRRRIRCHNAVFGSYTDRIRLKWHGSDYYNYSLQLKTNSNYGKGINVRYYITHLWFDHDMAESRPSAAGEPKMKC